GREPDVGSLAPARVASANRRRSRRRPTNARRVCRRRSRRCDAKESATARAFSQLPLRSCHSVFHHGIRLRAPRTGAETSQQHRVCVLPFGPYGISECGCTEAVEERSGSLLREDGGRRKQVELRSIISAQCTEPIELDFVEPVCPQLSGADTTRRTYTRQSS